MADLLNEYNRIGLIDKLEGDDERFNKIARAADSIAEQFRQEPSLLIPALLSGLDPDVSANDPAIELAEEALIKVWTSVRSVHVDPPIVIYRSILLDACDQVAQGKYAVALWNTAADTLPLRNLGKEESAITNLLLGWATESENYTLIVPAEKDPKRAPATKSLPQFEISELPKTTVKGEQLKNLIAAATGPNYRNNEIPGVSDWNGQWSNSPPAWSWEFTDRMASLLENRFNGVYSKITESYNSLLKQLIDRDEQQVKHIQAQLTKQKAWVQDTIQQEQQEQSAARVKLDSLWWSEALYSPSVNRSYREFDPFLSSVLMAFDLMEVVGTPTPASVAYTLSEASGKLPEMGFETKYKIAEILDHLHTKRALLPAEVINSFEAVPLNGLLTIRDLVVACLQGSTDDFSDLIRRAGITLDFTISLPKLSQAIFRQEQARKIVGE